MIAFVDCFCGVAGDMLLGALLDAGAPVAALRSHLKRLPIDGYSLKIHKRMRGPIQCTNVEVSVKKDKHRHRAARAILSMIAGSTLPPRVRKNAGNIFTALAEAEGKIHGISPKKVKFHEVGAIDSIVDIVGTCILLEALDIDQMSCSPIPVFYGEVATQHGKLPVPAPAATELLKGFPLVPTDITKEIVTPTGAAILATLVSKPGVFPEMRLTSTGYGAGDYDLPQRPDFLRVLIGEPVPASHGDVAMLLETNLDDIPGEDVGFLFDALFEAGALDVYTTPIQMKKSRPAITLSVLVLPTKTHAIEDVLLKHTTTFGIRKQRVERTILDRKMVTVKTRYGAIRVKVGRRNGHILKAAPEYEDVRKAAQKHDVPLSLIREEALRKHQS